MSELSPPRQPLAAHTADRFDLAGMTLESNRYEHEHMQKGTDAHGLLVIGQMDQFDRLQQIVRQTTHRIKDLICSQALARRVMQIHIR